MDLNVTIIQTNLHWENVTANLEALDKHISKINEPTDIVVLPEMFTTGFTMQPMRVAEKMNGDTMQWMTRKAARLNAVVTGSIVIEEEGFYYNRLIWMQPDGIFEKYDKHQLFTLAKEHEVYAVGQERLIVEWRGWKICPLICYDLRFPVWARNTVDYDALIYVANWPINRSSHWKILLAARAIENQSYVIGVNRCGEDKTGLVYLGDSMIISPAGNIQGQISEVEGVLTQVLSKEKLTAFRRKLPFLNDRDKFVIN